jgi:hypothetical protein
VADYLTRLVERTLGLSPAIRPDILPAFAPQTGDLPLPAPDSYPPPSYATRRADGPPQRPDQGLHPKPPHRLEEGAPFARNEEGTAKFGEQANTPPSMADDPGALPVTPSARGVRPLETSSAGEGAEIEHHLAGSGEDEHPPESEEHQRRPAPWPASSDEPAKPEALTSESRTAPDLGGTAPSEQPETPRVDRDDTDRTGERLPRRFGVRRRPAKRQAASRGVTDGSAHSANEVAWAPSSARAPATPAPSTGVPDLAVRPARERPTTPGVTQADRLETPDLMDRPLVSGESGTLGHHARSTDEKERVSQGPAPGTSSVADRPTSMPHPAAPSRREAAQVTQPPKVRISIGRVEVRAIPPEPAVTQPPVEERSESALSLDDYMKQVGGGSR